MPREPITIIEIDYEGCSLTFGTGLCTAALTALVPKKCFNTYATCKVRPVFAPVTKTLRFAEPRAGLPKDQIYFPAVRSVSTFSSTVNIAGADDSMGPTGRRATVKVELQDFAYHDRSTDPYQAQRVSGAAQFGGVGYDPAKQGTFFAKLKARWPYYAGRPLRVIQGTLVNGVITGAVTRNFIITNLSPPDAEGRVVLEGKDILDLADNDKALAPAPSRGVLLAGIAVGAGALTLTPAGIGNTDYPASGKACIGSEIVSFTRAADVVTLTARGIGGSKEAGHAAGDTFQLALDVDYQRVDDFAALLLTTYAKVPSAFVPKVAKWEPEISRWMPQVKLKTIITSPTGVAKLLGELSVLGVSIWWDDVAQEVGMKTSRPPDGDTVFVLSETANIKDIEGDERDEDRLTEVLFFSVQQDQSKAGQSADNFARLTATVDIEAEGPRKFNDRRIRKIYGRWFDDGADAVVGSLSRRLLNRFNTAPLQAKIRLDAKDSAIKLTDVLQVTSRVFQDDTGLSAPVLLQVVRRSDPVPGHEIELLAQAYQYSGRYAYATENTRPVYLSSNDAQKARGMYAADNTTKLMSNGDEPYRAI